MSITLNLGRTAPTTHARLQNLINHITFDDPLITALHPCMFGQSNIDQLWPALAMNHTITVLNLSEIRNQTRMDSETLRLALIATLPRMTALAVLSLRDCKLDTTDTALLGPLLLTQLSTLRRLDASRNPGFLMVDATVAAYTAHPHLYEVYLARNNQPPKYILNPQAVIIIYNNIMGRVDTLNQQRRPTFHLSTIQADFMMAETLKNVHYYYEETRWATLDHPRTLFFSILLSQERSWPRLPNDLWVCEIFNYFPSH